MYEESGNLKLVFTLLKSAAKNPAQTLRLLSYERVKNLYITLFKQSDSAKHNILDHYQQLFDEENNEPSIALQDWDNITVRPQDLSFPYAPTPEVSIIIPVHNQFDTTLRCLQSIRENTEDISYEIILADDASTDGTRHLQQSITNIKVSQNRNNLGFLKNCNKAAEQAKAPYLLFLNNDTYVMEGWLETLLQTIQRDEKTGIVGAKLIYPDGKLQEAGGIIFSDGSGWNYGRNDDPGKPEYNYVKEVDYVSGACLLIRKTIWNITGGFDERYSPAYYEDTDLAFETRKLGYKVIYQPQSVVVHFEGISCGTDENSGIKKYQTVNKDKFHTKWQSTLTEKHFKSSIQLFQARERNKEKKTILVIDHQIPLYDEDAGARSTFHYLTWFVAKGFTVKFIGDDFSRHERYTNALQQLGIEVLYGPWYAKNWKKWLKENGHVFDYVYLHRPQIALKYIDTVKKYTKAKVIFFGHDLHYLRTQRQYEVEKNKNLLEIAKGWKKKELAIFNKADVIYYPSEVEVAEVKKHTPSAIVRAIPLYIYEHIEPIQANFENRRNIFFVGGFRHEPNVDGVLWFANKVLPLIVQELPDIQFLVAGSTMPATIKNLNSNHLVILGKITQSELEQHYSQSRVFVAPLRYGAGIKGKILESLSFQLPIVTTTCGAEGLPNATNFMKIADAPQEFADNIISIYKNQILWQQLSQRGRDFLLNDYSLDRVTEIIGKDFTR